MIDIKGINLMYMKISEEKKWQKIEKEMKLLEFCFYVGLVERGLICEFCFLQ